MGRSLQALFRGTGVVPMIELFITKHGKSEYQRLVSLMPKEYQDLYIDPEKVDVGKDYPLLSHIKMLEVMDAEIYPDLEPDEWLPQYMFAQMDFGMNGFYRIVVKLANAVMAPQKFKVHSMRFWRRYHNTGNYYFMDGGATDITMLLTDFEGNHYPIMVDALRNCFIAVLSLSNAKNVKCRSRHIPRKNGVEYLLSWD